MSMMLMVQAMKTEVGSPLRKLVLMKLADNANDQGECWPSYRHIAAHCEISRRSVMRHINDLEQSGLLQKRMRMTPTGNTSNLYVITLPGATLSLGGDRESLGGCQSVTPVVTECHPESVNEPVIEPTTTPTADAEGLAVAAESDTRKTKKLPDCPHQEILALWADVLPHCRQPLPSAWPGTDRARNLAARWKACFTLTKPNGEPFYTDRETGLDWWRRFFGYIANNEYLMRGHRWFDLEWVVRQRNFLKIIERKYEEDAV